MKIIIPALLSVLSLQVQAQVTNSGNLQIHPGASVSGLGNFTNTASGVLVNNGNLYLKGDLSNEQASMLAGSGTLHLDGSSAQTVSGSQAFKTYNLVTNNAAGFTLGNNLSIGNTHTFSAGIITTSATPNYIIYEAGSSYSGSSDGGHVNGWIKKIGSTDFTFPVGNGTYERPVALNSLSEASEFDVRYMAPSPNANQLVVPVLAIQALEYWTINRVSGGSATVSMNWNNNKVLFPDWPVPDLLTTRYNGSNWIDAGGAGTASGNVSTTGAISSGSVSNFGQFTIGSMAYAVPMTLISFNAKRVSSYTEIAWQAVNEHNLAHYTVERSNDNLTFYAVEQVKARNTAGNQKYLAKDYKAIDRIAFYRLRSTDSDGKERLSKVVAITAGQHMGMSLLANPVRDKVSLMAEGNMNGLFSYNITSVSGQVIQSGTLSIQGAGKYELALEKQVARGTYSLVIRNKEQSYTFKLLVH
ncbi:MAG TPA: hypothetical protein VD993_13265 [Chitinophagaceae bacterium]|nr:hypothetical protein [Chitinophagaceae bacterium]